MLQKWQTYFWSLLWKAGTLQNPRTMQCYIKNIWKEKWRCNTNRRMRRKWLITEENPDKLLSLKPCYLSLTIYGSDEQLQSLTEEDVFLEPLIHSATVWDTENTAVNKKDLVRGLWRTQFKCELSRVLIYLPRKKKDNEDSCRRWERIWNCHLIFFLQYSSTT